MRKTITVLACAALVATPLPGEPALRELMGQPGRIGFLASLGRRLDALDAQNIAAFREAIARGLADGSYPEARAAEALRMVDSTWAGLDPRGFLEISAQRQRTYSLDAQEAALAVLLQQDLENAIRFYLKLPIYDNFQQHCRFYEKLSAIDPARAVRLYFESADSERTFDNPLTIAFTAWARREPDAAWAAAAGIVDEKKRRAARGSIIRELAGKNPEKMRALLATVPDDSERRSLAVSDEGKAQPPPPAAVQPDVPDDAVLEQIIAAGYDAYQADSVDRDGKKIASLFKRFPERAWAWLKQIDSGDPYADNRYRDLAGAWPKNQLAADAARLLSSRDLKDRRFGVHLGIQWMAADPEAAVPWLFSRHPERSMEFRNALPFHAMIYQKRWDRGMMLALADRIENPACRDLVRREVVLEEIRSKAPAEGLPLLLALENPVDRDRVIGSFVRNGIRREQGSGFIRLLMDIGPDHAELRDRMLELLPYEILDTHDADEGAIPEIVAAIRKPECRLRAIEKMGSKIPRILNERLICILAGLPAGTARDRRIELLLGELPAGDLLGFIRRIDEPLLRRMGLARIDSKELSDSDFAACLVILEGLPPIWRDESLTARWILAKAGRAAVHEWPEILKRCSGNRNLAAGLHGVMESWLEKDPKAALDALLSTGPNEQFSGWIYQAFHAVNQKDHAATFRDLCSRPVLMNRLLPDLFRSWSSVKPSAACAASLLVEARELRVPLLGMCLGAWAGNDITSATAWAKGLPVGPERTRAIEVLAGTFLRAKTDLPDWLKAELPREQPKDPDAARKKALAEMQARDARQRTIAAIRAMAALDENAVVANVRDLPDGPDKVDSALGLLEHAVATGNDRLAREMTDLVRTMRPDATMAVAVTGEMLHEIVVGAARVELASAMLDHRPPRSGVLAAAALDEDARRRIDAWIQQEAAKQR